MSRGAESLLTWAGVEGDVCRREGERGANCREGKIGTAGNMDWTAGCLETLTTVRQAR